MAGIRAYIYDPPGSSNCPGALQGSGCYNTGHIDLNAAPGMACANPDPQQFANLAAMISYANSRGETLRQFADVQAVNAICGAPPPGVGLNAPSLTRVNSPNPQVVYSLSTGTADANCGTPCGCPGAAAPGGGGAGPAAGALNLNINLAAPGGANGSGGVSTINNGGSDMACCSACGESERKWKIALLVLALAVFYLAIHNR